MDLCVKQAAIHGKGFEHLFILVNVFCWKLRRNQNQGNRNFRRDNRNNRDNRNDQRNRNYNNRNRRGGFNNNRDNNRNRREAAPKKPFMNDDDFPALG